MDEGCWRVCSQLLTIQAMRQDGLYRDSKMGYISEGPKRTGLERADKAMPRLTSIEPALGDPSASRNEEPKQCSSVRSLRFLEESTRILDFGREYRM
jgi:hypothetical protein